MTKDKISVKDLRAHAHVLRELNMMPSLERLLAVVVETRQKYMPLLEAARENAKNEVGSAARRVTR
jgi:hypothetical protein